VTRSNGGSEVNIVTEKAPRSLRYSVLDVTPGSPLEFELEIINPHEPMHPDKLRALKAWLCGSLNYKKLVIQHADFRDYYFNCILNSPEDIYIGGGYRGVKVTCVCDSGGAWQNEKTKPYPLYSGGTIIFNNESDSNDYLYPIISFEMSDGESQFSICNKSDNNRLTEFAGLYSGETITVNGRTGEIKSSSGLLRVSNFNKNFLRLKRGRNVLECSPGTDCLTITFQNFRRLGGG